MSAPVIGYCTVDDLLLYGYQGSQDDAQLFQSIISRISAAIDAYLGVFPGYFYAYDGSAAASDRTFVGRGDGLLLVDPYQTLISVSAPTGNDVPTYVQLPASPAASSRNRTGSRMHFYLQRTYDNGSTIKPTRTSDVGWTDGLLYTVNAKWGWPAVPPEIIEACAETCILFWRTRDVAFSRTVNLVTNTVVGADAFPPRVKMILDKFKAQTGVLNFA